MDGTGVEKIASLAVQATAPRTIEIHDGTYSDRDLKRIRRKAPGVEPLCLMTLTGLLDYLTKDPDGISSDLDTPRTAEMVAKADIVQVLGPTSVQVLTSYQADDVLSRLTLAKATFEPPTSFTFGRWLSVEDFMISVQTLFTSDGDRDAVLARVGNVSHEHAITRKDDGVTQAMAVRAGVVSVDKIVIENPFRLAPFRSFPEVEQVLAPFILRMKGGGKDGEIMAALFEADGGMWRIEAAQRVQQYILEKLTNTPAARLLVIR
jgi:hypothetical protein